MLEKDEKKPHKMVRSGFQTVHSLFLLGLHAQRGANGIHTGLQPEDFVPPDLCSSSGSNITSEVMTNLICISDSVCYCTESILKLENDALSLGWLFAVFSLKGSFPLL